MTMAPGTMEGVLCVFAFSCRRVTSCALVDSRRSYEQESHLSALRRRVNQGAAVLRHRYQHHLPICLQLHTCTAWPSCATAASTMAERAEPDGLIIVLIIIRSSRARLGSSIRAQNAVCCESFCSPTQMVVIRPQIQRHGTRVC